MICYSLAKAFNIIGSHILIDSNNKVPEVEIVRMHRIKNYWLKPNKMKHWARAALFINTQFVRVLENIMFCRFLFV